MKSAIEQDYRGALDVEREKQRSIEEVLAGSNGLWDSGLGNDAPRTAEDRIRAEQGASSVAVETKALGNSGIEFGRKSKAHRARDTYKNL